MLDIAAQRASLSSLVKATALRQARILTSRELQPLARWGVQCALETQVTVEERDVELVLGVDRKFPLSLPRVFLRPQDALGRIPHVVGDGFVCYADEEGLVVNFDDPVGLLEEALGRAICVLADGVTGRNRWDFLDEFAVYWDYLTSTPAVKSFVQPDDVLRPVVALKRGSTYGLVAEQDLQSVSEFDQRGDLLRSHKRRPALYVPLQDGTFLLPPWPERPWGFEEVKAIVRENLSPGNLAELGRQFNGGGQEELVILALPRPSGGRTLIGLLYEGTRGGHPLLTGKSPKSPTPLKITRYDAAFLKPRGGGRLDLRQARVLLAGCGSVGGYVALALARAGVGNLTLADPDLLESENTFRHVLGKSAVGQPKAPALKREIEAKYPYVRVSAEREHVEDLLASNRVDLTQCDLLVLAIGNPTVELHVNRLIHRRQDGPPVVFTWLEPYGIGGHALLTRPGQVGCFQCLYAPTSAETPLANRAAFAEYGQSFGRNDLGCRALYTPYGATDAEKTADLAVRLCLDTLMGREQGSPLASWKGPVDDFTAAGFRLSPRYALSPDQLHERRYDYVAVSCRACGGRVW